MKKKSNKAFNEQFNDNFTFFDGAMGTMLQNAGLETGQLPETYNISHPEIVSKIHTAYLESGANIISANTFGANRLKFDGSSYSAGQVIRAGVTIARESIDKYLATNRGNNKLDNESNKDRSHNSRKYVALDIGPIGSLLSPLGTLTFDDAYDIFKDQVIAGAEAGADIILIETMTDLYETKAAILAAKENSDLPVFCTMSFEENGRTFMGTDVATFVFVAEGLGVDALGANCSLGPSQLQVIVDQLLKYSSTPVMIQANAGLPKYENNTTFYDIKPEEYSNEIQIMAQKGVSIFGGCCGTTPDYIKDMTKALNNLQVKEIIKKDFTTCTSSSKTVFLGEEVKIIGERINPTGKKHLKEALKSNDLDYIVNEAIEQKDTGSDILDINVGLPGIDEKEMMVKVVEEVQSMVPLPLQIDSADPDVISAAARIYNGKPIINSVNGKKDNMNSIFPIVKKYGALVIGLTLDEDGIPSTAKKRFEIATKIIETAKTYGIPKENILIDPLVLTASAEQDSVMETLKSIPLIKDKYKVKIVLGASNISFGLPNRSLLNTTYLAIALSYGLDAPITDSTDEGIMGVIRSFKVLANQDKDSKEYIKAYGDPSLTDLDDKKIPSKFETNKAFNKSNDLNEDSYWIEKKTKLQEIIIKGLYEEAKVNTIELLKEYNSLTIINEIIMPALDIVGEKYDKQIFFLPQLINSGETAKEVFKLIKDHTVNEDKQGKEIVEGEKVVMATVQGDIHDIGKNIVSLLLENYGYQVIDLGKDVPIDKIVKLVMDENIKLLGLSALMTTTVENMETTIKEVKKHTPNVKIMVGGAVLTDSYAKEIGADYYSPDAKGAVDIAREVFSKLKKNTSF